MSLNTILATTPLVSTNYILKATGTTIGNSLIWDNGTNVGIGNQGTTYTLDVSGSLRSTTSAYFATTSGSVGIGTASPSEQLNLMGAGAYTSKIRISWGSSATSYYTNFGYNSDGNKAYLQIADGGAAATIMTWNYNGNVGIGTSSPSQLLDIVGTTPMINIQAGANTNARGIQFNYNGSFNAGSLINYGATGETVLSGGASGTSGYFLTFKTDGSERMRITSGGAVCIGTTTATNSGLLEMAGSTTVYNLISLKDTGTASSSVYYITFFNSSNGFAGGVQHTTASTVTYYTGPSDQRLKSNIKDIEESVLPLFNDIKLKTYNHIADEDESVVYKGFLAQDMVDNFPEAYGKDKEGYYMYNPTGYIPYLVKAIQEMNTKLDEQNQTIQNLQEQINILAK